VVLLLLCPGFSADPDLCHRSGNPHWLLCGLIHFFLFGGGGEGGCKKTITVENHVIKLAGKYGGP